MDDAMDNKGGGVLGTFVDAAVIFVLLVCAFVL